MSRKIAFDSAFSVVLMVELLFYWLYLFLIWFVCVCLRLVKEVVFNHLIYAAAVNSPKEAIFMA
jgi:hypothetical protein